MKNKLIIKTCHSCGVTIKIMSETHSSLPSLQCCGEEMTECVPNSVDAAIEKHVPTYEKVEDEIFVKVNHVMEKEHFIEWITLVAGEKEYTVTLYPEQNAEVRFPYISGSCLYAYCNKHGRWKKEVN